MTLTCASLNLRCCRSLNKVVRPESTQAAKTAFRHTYFSKSDQVRLRARPAFSRSHRRSVNSPDVQTNAIVRKMPGESVLSPITIGISERIEADSEFWFKMGVEICFDQFITGLTNLAVLGSNPWLWSTGAIAQAAMLHFTALFNDAVLVWYLAPKVGTDISSPKAQISHCFQSGPDFTLADRVACWFSKFSLYSAIGSMTALLSALCITTLTARACTLQYLATAFVVGAISLGVSSNTRYQIVNGIEILLYNAFPKTLARLLSAAFRIGNNFLGARIFLMIAAFAGL
ncbi:hypothetical protein CYMTET_19042 [Cymbomonas tetramitiformis]|uniref:Uncharacterized protein n=1 Tax=Cymbomonas tetramitiformis TaxID=36881 RepID=A0AAE0G6T3_9CHLO|nr:hypothetical protein CYMTET_19042 [Cymbomonas tetramitiformis]